MKKKRAPCTASDRAIRIILEHGGVIRTGVAVQAGIHPRTICQLRDSGILEQLARGVYRLAESGESSNPDLVAVAVKIPKAVICLVSALAFHEITTQIPHRIFISLPAGSKAPLLDFPPIQVHKFSSASYSAGIEEHQIDGVSIKIYSPEKTIADCFKFRNKIGMDIVLEALKLYRNRLRTDYNKLLEYGDICRVKKVMLPYLEAGL
ncbi:MAG: type IV toxin-antitoxin system AbiEi family antitoxin domain-containing protein [Candidatus Sabulitectum sp.]|nr:type IV toxin-antitoxin system AbiEi family antitoxin domain-containing protein [Candidatus Sabulitectum sp.]